MTTETIPSTTNLLASPAQPTKCRRPRRIEWPNYEQPALRFSPTAWAKLLYLRDCGPTEVGGFAITAENDLLRVEDVQLVRQQCSAVYVAFDDDAVADFFDQQVDQGLRPDRFARIWLHTHPGKCALPSSTDEETFERVFGKSDWALMFILAKEGQTYARLRFSVGPGGQLMLPVTVDYQQPFPASDQLAWQQEYLNAVQPCPFEAMLGFGQTDPWWPPDEEQLLDHERRANGDDSFPF